MGWTNLTFSYGSVLTSAKMTQMFDNDVVAAPTGKIIIFAGTSAPVGYLVCPTAISNISRTIYAALFAVIGTTWGVGDGSATFGMPFFYSERAPLQSSGDVGTYYGGQMPEHTHTVAVDATAPIAGVAAAYGSAYADGSFSTGSAGSGLPNFPTGHRVLFCVKY
jgi:microcystin-dependent protein